MASSRTREVYSQRKQHHSFGQALQKLLIWNSHLSRRSPKTIRGGLSSAAGLPTGDVSRCAFSASSHAESHEEVALQYLSRGELLP